MTATLLFGFFPLIFFSFAAMVGLVLSAFWVWMLVDCAQYETNDNSSKVVWILVILFTHVLGAILYFFIRKQARTRF